MALGQDNTEANYVRLCDVKARLSTLDGTEALVEGFGASSGRAPRNAVSVWAKNAGRRPPPGRTGVGGRE